MMTPFTFLVSRTVLIYYFIKVTITNLSSLSGICTLPPTSYAHFSEPVTVHVSEGGVANFTVLRAGRADFVATVMYRVEYGGASPDDLVPLSNDTTLVFDVGEWMKNISVAVEDDNIPETDEPFYIVLYNATGKLLSV